VNLEKTKFPGIPEFPVAGGPVCKPFDAGSIVGHP